MRVTSKSLVLLSGVLGTLAGCPSAVQGPGEGGAQPGRGFENAMTAGKAALIGDQPEHRGYGLYSYLLLVAPPTDANRERYLQALAALVRSVPDIQILESKGFDPRQLNITYVLLQEAPPPQLLTQPRPFAEWALVHYNYVRSRSLVQSVADARGEGPYLISSLQPLSGSSRAPRDYLYQNLSSVAPSCIKVWLAEFLDRAGRPMTRDRASGEQLADKLREVLARAAGSCPDALEYAGVQWRTG